MELTRHGFHGRETELAAFDEVLANVAGGRLQAVLLEGEAGIGKSRLLANLTARAERLGFAVHYGAAAELEVGRPFGAVADALGCSRGSLGPHAAQIAELLSGGPDGEDSAGTQFRILDRMLELLERTAVQQPVALVVDDAHWADASTLMTLATVARRLATLPVALCLAFRPSPAVADLQRLVESLARNGARQLTVGPLEHDAVEAIVVDVLGATPGPRLRAHIDAAGGNPLFIGELLAALGEQGLLAQGDGQVEIGASTLPSGLRQTILRRLSFLPPEAVELLRLAAVLGVTFETSELSAVAGMSARTLVRVLDEPVRAGVVDAAGEPLRFRHELIRAALYEEIPAGLRNQIHMEVARSLASAGISATRVANHFAIGASRGDLEAVIWLRRAAKDAAFTDPPTGIRLLRQVLDLLDLDDPQEHAVRAELVTLLAYGGRPDEAERTARELLAFDLDPSVDSSVRAALIHCLFVQARWDQVVTEVDAARRLSTLVGSVRARLLAEGALARVWTGDLDGAADDAREAVRLGRECRDAVAVSGGLAHLSVVADQRGEFQDGVELARQGVEAAVGGGAPEAERRHPHIALGMALCAADRLRESKEALQEGRRLGERMGTVWDLPLYHTMLALPMLYLGEWDDATAEAEAGLSLAEELGSGVGRVTAHAVLATIAIHRNKLTAAQHHVQAADDGIATAGPQWGMLWLNLARAALVEATGDTDGGLRVLVENWGETVRSGSLEGSLRMGPAVVRAALQSGDTALAASVADAVGVGAARARVPYADAAALVCAGLVWQEPTKVLAAVELYRADERLPEQAAAHEDAGTVLASAGRLREAASSLGAAVAQFERLGATRDTGRVLGRMRAAGLRRANRGPQIRATTGWEALTKTEREVVRFAAEGLTNNGIGERLFISPRTVQTHMAHIFAKLALSSRVQLAAAASRQAAGIGA